MRPRSCAWLMRSSRRRSLSIARYVSTIGGTSPRYCVNSCDCDRPTEACRRERRCGATEIGRSSSPRQTRCTRAFLPLLPAMQNYRSQMRPLMSSPEALEKTLARIEKTALLGDKKAFLLTVDYSIGMGSYSGHTTMLVKVQNRHLKWVSAMNPDTSKSAPIPLPKTSKTGWELPDAGRDVLAVYCRPDFDTQDNFTIRYMRYRWDQQKGWLMYEEAEKVSGNQTNRSATD